jgi:hypothetical protein
VFRIAGTQEYVHERPKVRSYCLAQSAADLVAPRAPAARYRPSPDCTNPRSRACGVRKARVQHSWPSTRMLTSPMGNRRASTRRSG